MTSFTLVSITLHVLGLLILLDLWVFTGFPSEICRETGGAASLSV